MPLFKKRWNLQDQKGKTLMTSAVILSLIIAVALAIAAFLLLPMVIASMVVVITSLVLDALYVRWLQPPKPEGALNLT